MERVVVTGLGVISCIGLDVPAFWKSLIGGVSGVDRISVGALTHGATSMDVSLVVT